MAARIDRSGSRGSPAAAFQMLQQGANNALIGGLAVRRSPSKALQLLEMGSACAARTRMSYAATILPVEQEPVEMGFDPDAFFRTSLPSSLPSSQESHNCNEGEQEREQKDQDPQSIMQLCEKACAGDSTNANSPHTHNANPGIPCYASSLQTSNKREFACVERREQSQYGSSYQQERQKLYKKERDELEQQMQQAQTRVIQSGRQTSAEVSRLLRKTEAKTIASDVGKTLTEHIQSLENVVPKNSTQRGQLRRTQTKLRTLITKGNLEALECILLLSPQNLLLLSAGNSMMSLSEAAKDFCAP